MIPQTFTVISEHIRFYFLVFLFYTFYSRPFRLQLATLGKLFTRVPP